MSIKNKKYSWVVNISGLKKLAICIFLSIIIYASMLSIKMDLKSSSVVAWDSFCLGMIFFNWLLFYSTKPNDLCAVVEKQDDGLKILFIIILVAIAFSLFGTLFLLKGKGESTINKILHTAISLSPVFLSWILLHTTFAIRYAHLHHDHNRLNTGSNIGGIDFPQKEHPDYIDFAYFSFVIGMTFQVSDVVVSSSVIRRFVLMHSIISFVFNTIILALSINTIAGLLQ